MIPFDFAINKFTDWQTMTNAKIDTNNHYKYYLVDKENALNLIAQNEIVFYSMEGNIYVWKMEI